MFGLYLPLKAPPTCESQAIAPLAHGSHSSWQAGELRLWQGHIHDCTEFRIVDAVPGEALAAQVACRFQGALGTTITAPGCSKCSWRQALPNVYPKRPPKPIPYKSSAIL